MKDRKLIVLGVVGFISVLAIVLFAVIMAIQANFQPGAGLTPDTSKNSVYIFVEGETDPTLTQDLLARLQASRLTVFYTDPEQAFTSYYEQAEPELQEILDTTDVILHHTYEVTFTSAEERAYYRDTVENIVSDWQSDHGLNLRGESLVIKNK